MGQKAEIVAIAYPDDPMQGTVRFIANTAKIAQGRTGLSFVVKIDIEDPGEVTLRPGMSCRAEIFGMILVTDLLKRCFSKRIKLKTGVITLYSSTTRELQKTKVEVGLSDDEFQELLSEMI